MTIAALVMIRHHLLVDDDLPPEREAEVSPLGLSLMDNNIISFCVVVSL